MISVVIPVGPNPSDKRWLDEAIVSLHAQSFWRWELVLVDDGADLDEMDIQIHHNPSGFTKIKLWKPPMRLGISHAFNAGVGLASNDCVFMLGSDDTLEPTCLERCWEAYNKTGGRDGYYSVPIKYMDTGEIQTAPCNAAMVTKKFWRYTGGFPIESAIGMGDSIFLSICLAHKLPVFWVGDLVDQDDVPLYNYRRHPDIHTYKIGKYFGVLNELRDILTRDWVPNVDGPASS